MSGSGLGSGVGSGLRSGVGSGLRSSLGRERPGSGLLIAAPLTERFRQACERSRLAASGSH